MKLRSYILVMIVLCSMAACSEKVPAKAATSKPSTPPGMEKYAALISQIDALNDTCRGGAGDSKKTMDACYMREELIASAQQSNLCWGPQEAIGADKHWIRCSEDPLYKRKWYSQDLNHANCIESGSPADRMRMIQESGSMPKTIDRPNGAVEVEVGTGNGDSRYWTYFKTMERCLQSLSRAQVIDKKYE